MNIAVAPPQVTHAAVVRHLRSQKFPVFAILDAARDPAILPLLEESGLERQSLYDGEQGEDLAPYGPWLIALAPGSPFVDELIRAGWGKSWGVFLTCDRPFAEVRRHLRRFLLVKLPDGKTVYFRYYDPRVLRTYLPTCTPEEVAEFLGPFGWYIVEDEGGLEVLEFIASVRTWHRAGLRP